MCLCCVFVDVSLSLSLSYKPRRRGVEARREEEPSALLPGVAIRICFDLDCPLYLSSSAFFSSSIALTAFAISSSIAFLSAFSFFLLSIRLKCDS